jgi:hypothetical protein
MTTKRSSWRGRRCIDCGMTVCALRVYDGHYWRMCSHCAWTFHDEVILPAVMEYQIAQAMADARWDLGGAA